MCEDRNHNDSIYSTTGDSSLNATRSLFIACSLSSPRQHDGSKIKKYERPRSHHSYVRIIPSQSLLIPVAVSMNIAFVSITAVTKSGDLLCIANQTQFDSFNCDSIEVCRDVSGYIGFKSIAKTITNLHQAAMDILNSLNIPNNLIESMMHDGWTDVSIWNQISDADLEAIGFKSGHIAMFRHYQQPNKPQVSISSTVNDPIYQIDSIADCDDEQQSSAKQSSEREPIALSASPIIDSEPMSVANDVFMDPSMAETQRMSDMISPMPENVEESVEYMQSVFQTKVKHITFEKVVI